MRLLTHRFSRLGAIVLLAGATGAAAHPRPQGPLAERGTWALGFDLPYKEVIVYPTGSGSTSGTGFSLWKIRSPETALGLEGAFSWARSDHELDAGPRKRDQRYTTLKLQLRPTFKRYGPLRHRVAPYFYAQGLGSFMDGREEESWYLDTTTTSMVELGVGLGLGADWFPFKRISIGGRTGLSLRYGFGESRRWVESSTSGEFRKYPSTDRELSFKILRSELTALVYF